MALDALMDSTAAADHTIGNLCFKMASMWQIVIVTDAHLLLVDSCETHEDPLGAKYAPLLYCVSPCLLHCPWLDEVASHRQECPSLLRFLSAAG